jgi:hypothetical protein
MQCILCILWDAYINMDTLICILSSRRRLCSLERAPLGMNGFFKAFYSGTVSHDPCVIQTWIYFHKKRQNLECWLILWVSKCLCFLKPTSKPHRKIWKNQRFHYSCSKFEPKKFFKYLLFTRCGHKIFGADNVLQGESFLQKRGKYFYIIWKYSLVHFSFFWGLTLFLVYMYMVKLIKILWTLRNLSLPDFENDVSNVENKWKCILFLVSIGGAKTYYSMKHNFDLVKFPPQKTILHNSLSP